MRASRIFHILAMDGQTYVASLWNDVSSNTACWIFFSSSVNILGKWHPFLVFFSYLESCFQVLKTPILTKSKFYLISPLPPSVLSSELTCGPTDQQWGGSVLLLPSSVPQPPAGFGCGRRWQRKNSLSFNLAGATCSPLLDSKYPLLWRRSKCWPFSAEEFLGTPLPFYPPMGLLIALFSGSSTVLSKFLRIPLRSYSRDLNWVFLIPLGILIPPGILWGPCEDDDCVMTIWDVSLGNRCPLSIAGTSAAGFHRPALFLHWQL